MIVRAMEWCGMVSKGIEWYGIILFIMCDILMENVERTIWIRWIMWDDIHIINEWAEWRKNGNNSNHHITIMIIIGITQSAHIDGRHQTALLFSMYDACALGYLVTLFSGSNWRSREGSGVEPRVLARLALSLELRRKSIYSRGRRTRKGELSRWRRKKKKLALEAPFWKWQRNETCCTGGFFLKEKFKKRPFGVYPRNLFSFL